MKNWNSWGTKIRVNEEKNYRAIWHNLKTIRVGSDSSKELDPEFSEFYDVALGTRCVTGRCPFCYAGASKDGAYFKDPVGAWKQFMQRYTTRVSESGVIFTDAPFQIACGSLSEPTEHPEFVPFLAAVYESGVVPNYTTNGVILSERHNPWSPYYEKAYQIMRATRRYVGGVAVSFSNPRLMPKAKRAVKYLIHEGDTNVNIHHIISDKDSVNQMISYVKEYGDQIRYHVLLPLVFSKYEMTEEIFGYMMEQVERLDTKNIAFGAHFFPFLSKYKGECKTWIHEPEMFSKNLILGDNKIIITKSSYDLTNIKEYERNI